MTNVNDFGKEMIMQAVGKIVELGYVVTDLDKACEFFKTAFGVKSFEVYQHMPMLNSKFNDVVVDIDVDVAIGASGGMVFELIKQNNDAPSPFHAPDGQQLFVFNHWSIFTDHYDIELEKYLADGYQQSFYAEFDSEDDSDVARVVYLKLPSAIAGDVTGYLELIERNPPSIFKSYQKIINDAQ
ncbi:VOC family protein [Colwelliaceae bacterium 6441]